MISASITNQNILSKIEPQLIFFNVKNIADLLAGELSFLTALLPTILLVRPVAAVVVAVALPRHRDAEPVAASQQPRGASGVDGRASAVGQRRLAAGADASLARRVGPRALDGLHAVGAEASVAAARLAHAEERARGVRAPVGHRLAGLGRGHDLEVHDHARPVSERDYALAGVLVGHANCTEPPIVPNDQP